MIIGPRNQSTKLNRAGELPEHLAPARLRQEERSPVEQTFRLQNRYQDSFESAFERMRAEFDVAHKRPPDGLNRLLLSKEFQEKLQETVAGTSPRAQQVKQVESAYKAFWKDSQDFAVSKVNGPSLTVPEPPARYQAPAETAWRGRAMTVPDFKAVTDVSEAARVQAAEQTKATDLMARRLAAVTQQPFSLVGQFALRG